MKTIKVEGHGEVPAAKLLAALYNGAKPQGLGRLAAVHGPRKMTEEKAQEILDERGRFSFDYLFGRPLKIRAFDGSIGERDQLLYDRDAGLGAFEKAVEKALDQAIEYVKR